jgi:uncharacterized membrane protein (DUF106 family)
MSFLDSVYGPLIALDPTPDNPIITVLIIAFFIALFITILQKLLIDYDKMEEMQAEMKEIQSELREAQKSGDPKALAKVQKKQMDFMPKQKNLMIMQFKPTLITMIPILVIYYGMVGNYAISHMQIHIASTQFYLLFMPIWNIFWRQADPLTINFFGWYILCSFAFSFALRRLMGMKTI